MEWHSDYEWWIRTGKEVEYNVLVWYLAGGAEEYHRPQSVFTLPYHVTNLMCVDSYGYAKCSAQSKVSYFDDPILVYQKVLRF
jgi:hypothetical protein